MSMLLLIHFELLLALNHNHTHQLEWLFRVLGYNQLIACNILDSDDYTSFSNGRTLIDLNCDDKFIHFPRNLFGHFYYHIYANTPTQRNIIKEKIKNIA